MKPIHLLILEVAPHVEEIAAGGRRVAQWREEPDLADAALASLLTAAPVSRHGALSAWELTPDGQQIRLAPRHRLMCPPIWERLSQTAAVGLPWSSGSIPDGFVVTPDFVSPRLAAHPAVLPDRVHPPLLGRQLSEYRVSPGELDAATMLGLGFSEHAHREDISVLLSLHAIATSLIEQSHPQLAIVRLPLGRVTPAAPERTRAFLAAVQRRYEELSADATLLTLTRVFHHDHVHNILRSEAPETHADSALALGVLIARKMNTLQQFSRLPNEHWSQLKARYQSPSSTMPGTKAQIRGLQCQVEAGLASLERLTEC